MEKVAEIRLPLTIVADGTKAVAQLEKFKGQAGSISQKLKGFFAGEAAGAVGMLSGYFGIQGAISGLKELYAMGQRVNKLSETYSPEAVKASAQRDIAQLLNDMKISELGAPNAVKSANIETSDLQNATHAMEGLASAFSLSITNIISSAKNSLNSVVELAGGETSKAASSFSTAFSRMMDSGLLAFFDVFQIENQTNAARAAFSGLVNSLSSKTSEPSITNFLPPDPNQDAILPAANLSGSPAAANLSGSPAAASNGSEGILEKIERNTRGQR
jgi:uncharacterized ParB-like nuclease family protein